MKLGQVHNFMEHPIKVRGVMQHLSANVNKYRE
jgi:hypothetical protein